MRKSTLSACLVACLLAFANPGGGVLWAQSPGAPSRDSALLAALEQRVEDAVVARRLVVLDSIYAPGLRYKHSTGELETRAEWLAAVGRARYASRQIDSLDVDVHGDVALTTGRLHVRLAPDDPEWAQAPEWREYTVRYARAYARRGGRWRLLTHHSSGLTLGPPQMSARPADAPQSREEIARLLQQLEHEWAQVDVTNDRSIFDRIIAPDFVSTSISGKVRNRQEWLDAWEYEGITSARNSDVQVRIISDDVAVVTGVDITAGTDSAGQRVEHRDRFTDTWVKRNGTWQCVAAHVTRLE